MRRRTGGFTLIELMMVIAIIAIILAIAIPNLMSARRSANESNAISALRTITTTQAIFRENDKDGDGNLDYGMLSELVFGGGSGPNAQLVDPVLGSGTKSGYLFQTSYAFASSEFLWFAVANPAIPYQTGDRYFCTNQSGVIFYTTGASIALDTDSCAPPVGAVPTGK